MATQTTCPRCKNVLRVPTDAESRWLTCPRCLASVGNPNVLESTSPATTAVTEEPVSVPRTAEGPYCPGCGRAVEPSWWLCPYCRESLRGRRPPRAKPFEDEIRKDAGGTNVLALVLGGCLLLGVLCFFVVGGPNLLQASPDAGLALFIGLCVLAAAVAGIAALLFGRTSPGVTAVSGMLGGIAVGAGAVLLAVLVFCLTVIASINQFFETCSKGCK